MINVRTALCALSACAVFAGSAMGCKKDEPKADTTKAVTSASGAAASAAASGSAVASAAVSALASATASAVSSVKAMDEKAGAAAGEYAEGDVLKHMPKECKTMRAYFNMGKLTASEEVATHLNELIDHLAAAADEKKGKGDGPYKMLKDAGFDPAHDIEEVAICGNDKKVVVAIGGAFKTKEAPIDVLAKVMDHEGKKTKKEEGDGLKFLVREDGKKALSFVTPNVLVLSDDKPSIVAVAKAGDGSGFEGGKGNVFFFHQVEHEQDVEATIKENGPAMDLRVAMKLPADAVAAMKKDPKAVAGAAAALDKKVKEGLVGFEKGPFKPIADDLKTLKYTPEGDKMVITGAVQTAHLGEAIKAAAAMKTEDLMKSLPH
jgi:hypothetical protein